MCNIQNAYVAQNVCITHSAYAILDIQVNSNYPVPELSACVIHRHFSGVPDAFGNIKKMPINQASSGTNYRIIKNCLIIQKNCRILFLLYGSFPGYTAEIDDNFRKNGFFRGCLIHRQNRLSGRFSVPKVTDNWI